MRSKYSSHSTLNEVPSKGVIPGPPPPPPPPPPPRPPLFLCRLCVFLGGSFARPAEGAGRTGSVCGAFSRLGPPPLLLLLLPLLPWLVDIELVVCTGGCDLILLPLSLSLVGFDCGLLRSSAPLKLFAWARTRISCGAAQLHKISNLSSAFLLLRPDKRFLRLNGRALQLVSTAADWRPASRRQTKPPTGFASALQRQCPSFPTAWPSPLLFSGLSTPQRLSH